MRNITFTIYTLLFITYLTACTTAAEDPPALPPGETETYFQPGEYGGEALPHTEHLFWISPSPDGEKIALIRRHTPGKTDPLFQLWIMDSDGSNVELLTYNARGVDWHPFKNKISFTYNPHTTPNLYAFTFDLNTNELEI